MSTVAIIGAGDLGASVAQSLAARDSVRRIVLVDAASSVAAGKALDIMQSGAVDGFHTKLAGTDDIAAVTGCAVCVVADRAGPSTTLGTSPSGALGTGQPSQEWDGDNGLATVERVLQYSSGAPIVFAGATQATLLLRAARELHAARERLVGSAPEALASAVRAIVALEASCSPAEVTIAVLGAPAGGFVIPWSEASVGGYALDRVLTQAQLARLEGRAARLWPPGPYTLGLAAARVAEGMLTTARGSFSAFTLLDGEFGVRNHVGALPVRLSPRGVAGVRVPTLNTRERVRVETALRG